MKTVLTILKKIRGNSYTSSVPVMMVSAKSAEYDKVTGLDLGADDYIAKPFGMAELVARVKALLRRSGVKTTPEQLQRDELIVNVAKHTVTSAGQNITLTHKEFSLLAYLMENAGRAFTREQLLETVWGYDYEGGTRTVDVHVRRHSVQSSANPVPMWKPFAASAIASANDTQFLQH